MGARKQFTPEFKREAVQLVKSGTYQLLKSPVCWASAGINSIWKEKGNISHDPVGRSRGSSVDSIPNRCTICRPYFP